MVQCTVIGKYKLSDDQFDALVENGLVTKSVWWMKNLSKNEMVNYNNMTGGKRLPGNQQVNLNLELPNGNYQMGVGSWDVEVGGRHALQKFFFYVDEDGAHTCDKTELPTEDGAPASNTGTTGFIKKKTDVKIDALPVAKPQQSLSSIIHIIPDSYYCSYENRIVEADYVCDINPDCAIDATEDFYCMNCKHAESVAWLKRDTKL